MQTVKSFSIVYPYQCSWYIICYPFLSFLKARDAGSAPLSIRLEGKLERSAD
ncbi:hypothetical protein CHCC20372_1711 [Bacillus paralicheniformis]|nr:hypothetical protein CHCC20372_1711 [Bacillus paralicheniformis]